MIFSFLYNNQIIEIEAESAVQAIIIMMEYHLELENDKSDFEILSMKNAS
jgi:hypothetical protein